MSSHQTRWTCWLYTVLVQHTAYIAVTQLSLVYPAVKITCIWRYFVGHLIWLPFLRLGYSGAYLQNIHRPINTWTDKVTILLHLRFLTSVLNLMSCDVTVITGAKFHILIKKITNGRNIIRTVRSRLNLRRTELKCTTVQTTKGKWGNLVLHVTDTRKNPSLNCILNTQYKNIRYFTKNVNMFLSWFYDDKYLNHVSPSISNNYLR